MIQTQGRWVVKWKVPSRSGNGAYTVSISNELVWGCSCPVWKFRRQECHHIREIKAQLRADDDDGQMMRLLAIRIDRLKREGKTDEEIMEILSDSKGNYIEPFYGKNRDIDLERG